jgi:L-amino acid N-acyltransferase YncA
MSTVIHAATLADLPAIAAIANDAIANTTAIWNDQPTDVADRALWLSARTAQGYPVLIAEDGGNVVAYGSFGDFRPFDGYRRTVEHSLYVLPAARRRGIASALLQSLTIKAGALGKHVMVAGIAAENDASIALHRKHGFVETGRMPEVGLKFGRWLDLVFMQKRL